MESSRERLHKKLKEVADEYGMKVYFQPPDNTRLDYPCIIYKYDTPETQFADNIGYINKMSYEIMVVKTDHELDVIKSLTSKLKRVRFRRIYINDNMYHYVLAHTTTL